MSFLKNSINLFTGLAYAHMGEEQYIDHLGVDRRGRSMSGARLWASAEDARIKAFTERGLVNMANAELQLAKLLARRVNGYVEQGGARFPAFLHGVSVIDYGPGTVRAFSEKTLPIVNALRGPDAKCILVDRSPHFLEDIRNSPIQHQVSLRTVEDDIFAGNRYIPQGYPAFIVMFGRTFGNIIAPISRYAPEYAVVSALERIANGADVCWLAISIGSDLDGERARLYYEEHSAFQMNVFFRMKAELAVNQEFDPDIFRYAAVVQSSPEFLQIAHIAILAKSITFQIGDDEVKLEKGKRLHLKISFSFSQDFFRHCASLAGLSTVDLVTDSLGSDIHVFKKQEPKSAAYWKPQRAVGAQRAQASVPMR